MKIRPSLQRLSILALVTALAASGAALALAKTATKEDQPAGLAKILGEEPKKGAKQKPLKITGFEIVGNQNVSEQVILLTLESKIGKDFSQELVDRDVRALRNLGYFSTIVPQITPYRSGVKVVYRVVENPYIKDVKISGNGLVSTADILKALNVKKNAILNVSQLQEAIKRINKLYSDKGLAYCGILNQDQFGIDSTTQILSIRIAEPKLREVKVTGNKKTKNKVITREMFLKKGDVVRTEDLKRSLRNVYNLGYFEDVKPPEPKLTIDKQFMDLEMEVKEQKTGSASFGGGYSSVNGVIGFLDLAESNFRGNGQTIRAKIQFGGEKSYVLSFVEPWFQDRPVSLGLSLFKTAVDRQEIQNRSVVSRFRERRDGQSVTGGWRVGRDQRLATTFTNENVEVNGLGGLGFGLPADLQRLDKNADGKVEYGEQSLRLTWTSDDRDNPMNPHSGQRLSLTGGVTGVFLKGPNGFYQYTGDYRRYRTFDDVADGLTLAGRVRAGHTSVVDGELRFIDRFALGGTDTLRGFEDREFTGKDFLLGNIEVRKQFTKMFGLAAFVDSGDAFSSDGRDLDLKSSYGLGLRLNTPLGPFRLDYGKPFDDRDGRFHFGIGQQF
ncbi:MAG: BamA/TamA family outer membrane protein [Candidatus Wallbacteria bacterium]|nr:BamA/TamA family outer membrane protein [Candidatus Wallbacteria bacterium]